MITAAELAGFVAAQAVLRLANGENLIPILAYLMSGDERKVFRLISKDVAAAVASGRQALTSNKNCASAAVLAHGGRILLDEEEVDALLIEMRDYACPSAEATIAVPYTPLTDGDFRVHTPQVMTWTNCDSFDLHPVLEAFFLGIADNEQGAKVWNTCLDESK